MRFDASSKFIRELCRNYYGADLSVPQVLPAYTVKYCFYDTVIAVTGLTYDEAWQARKLHSQSGKTAWVEAE